MLTLIGALATFPPRHQADAFLNQANPVGGTPYAVLAATPNVRIISIALYITHAAAPTPLEVRVTIDGQVITFTRANPNTATPYYALHSSLDTAAGQPLDTPDHSADKAFLFEGRNVAIEAEITGAGCTLLQCRVKWARW